MGTRGQTQCVLTLGQDGRERVPTVHASGGFQESGVGHETVRRIEPRFDPARRCPLARFRNVVRLIGGAQMIRSGDLLDAIHAHDPEPTLREGVRA